jgi:hypothetical protein
MNHECLSEKDVFRIVVCALDLLDHGMPDEARKLLWYLASDIEVDVGVHEFNSISQFEGNEHYVCQ